MFRIFPDLLRGDELIVVNNARVIPARLFGRRLGVRPGKARPQSPHGARISVLGNRSPSHSGRVPPEEWEALVRPGRKMRVGERVEFGEGELFRRSD